MGIPSISFTTWITLHFPTLFKVNTSSGELYSQPETIPGEIKTQVARQIDEKKSELKTLYDSPEEVFTLKRVGKWSAIQVVKLMLGMPVVPGR